VLDDSYNSNPAAARFAVQVLSQAEPAGPSGRRILVFGDMLELGEAEVEAHREIGRVIDASQVDMVVGVGALAGQMVEVLEGGVPFLPVLIGVFAFAQIMADVERMGGRGGLAASLDRAMTLSVSHGKVIWEILSRPFLLLWTSFIGVVIGVLPAIGGSAVHCLAGKVPLEKRPAAERVFIGNLTWAADLAAAKKIGLLIEPINARDRPNYFLNHVEHAAEIISKVGKSNVRIQFDFYHAQIVGGDLIHRLEQFLPVIGHLQCAAVPSRHEPDEGEVSYPAVFAAVDALGYAGWIGAEYRPRARTEDGLAWGRPYGLRAPH